MRLRRNSNRKSFLLLASAMVLSIASGVAALAQSDWENLNLPRVESELNAQVQLLRNRPEAWANAVRDRAAFALYKINNAQISSNPAIENMHLRQACQAIADERALLIDAQLADEGQSELIESLIEQTFVHREVLGCGQ